MRNPYDAWVVQERDEVVMVCLSRVGADEAAEALRANGKSFVSTFRVPCAHALWRVPQAVKEATA